MNTPKIPRSVLVLIHTPDLHFLLLKRVSKQHFDHDFWQSVTGSLDYLDEDPACAARRELFEETGIIAAEHQFTDLHYQVEYEIFPQWRHRYAPDVTHNIEHQFAVCVASRDIPIQLAAQEHTDYQWLPFEQAAHRCFSWNNAAAIRRLAAQYTIETP